MAADQLGVSVWKFAASGARVTESSNQLSLGSADNDFERSRRCREMPIHLRLSIAVLVTALAFSSSLSAQSARPQQAGGASDQKATPAPAPRHDISGTWEPANGPSDGIQADGVKA